mmetsp:Transcript_129953/g.290077  ORF Transcript_129953/g.290077 Transcript_129953/m.290077 type:complete len:118 (-) Transcript_129953:21-374(-)
MGACCATGQATVEPEGWEAFVVEAESIYHLADKNGNFSLDIEELTNLRNNKEFAEAMMGAADTDLSGTISKSEWLAYLKGIFDKKEKAAWQLLKLYEKQTLDSKMIPKLETTVISGR